MAAADCVTVITKSLVSDPPATSTKPKPEKLQKSEKRALITPINESSDDAEATISGQETENALKEKGPRALWDNLDDTILLVIELQEGIVKLEFRFWQHVGVIEHWCGALQYWTQTTKELDASETQSADEMRGYALSCLALALGRLDSQRLEEVLKNIEPKLLQTLMNQVRATHIKVDEMAMAILRSLLFRSSAVTSKMEEIVPVLMDMLDTRDSAAKAVVLLVAKYLALFTLFITKQRDINKM